jgi:uncharacterized membrane protein YphA (DoxX/SURF4 family)
MFKVCAVVSILLALLALASAMGKLTKNPKIVEMLTALNVPLGWLPRLAAAEIAGAVGLLIGLKVPALGIAAGIGLILYFFGAVGTHLRAKDNNIAAPLVLGLVAVAAVVLRASTM